MIINGIYDKNNQEIDTYKVYKDVVNNVNDIFIVCDLEQWYAKPNELDAEPLSEVSRNLCVQT